MNELRELYDTMSEPIVKKIIKIETKCSIESCERLERSCYIQYKERKEILF